MFTGLITEVGLLAGLQRQNHMLTMLIEAPGMKPGIKPGDSIAVNGICLTVTEIVGRGFKVQAMPETLQRTTLLEWKLGGQVNLEKSLQVGDGIDGHFVSGHVDGVVEVIDLQSEGTAAKMVLSPPSELLKYIAEKGSVALDGISLTVARLLPDDTFSVGIIPYTRAHTHLKKIFVGQRMNLEVDLISRYAERLMKNTGISKTSDLTWKILSRNGFKTGREL